MNLADVIRRMKEVGAPPEAIVIALEAIAAATAGLDARRANDRARKALSRDRSRDCHVTDEQPIEKKRRFRSRDSHGTSPQEKLKTQPPTNTPLGPDGPTLPTGSGTEGAQARARVGGSRLPTEWAPSAALVAFAGDLGIVGHGFDEAAAEFRDYWRGVPGQRGRKVDWDATFRNRLRETAGRNKKGAAHGNGKGSIVDAGRRLTERLIAERKEREMRAGNSVDPGDEVVRFLPGQRS